MTFHVETDNGGYVTGKPMRNGKDETPGYTEDAARADANERNAKAERLGIKTRYVVVETK